MPLLGSDVRENIHYQGFGGQVHVNPEFTGIMDDSMNRYNSNDLVPQFFGMFNGNVVSQFIDGLDGNGHVEMYRNHRPGNPFTFSPHFMGDGGYYHHIEVPTHFNQ